MNRSEHAPWIDSDLSELVTTIQSGQRPYGGVTEDGGDIPSLGGENIREQGGIELSAVKKVSCEFFRSMTKGVLASQDVLINKDGANTGKVGIYEGQFPVASINEHLFLLRGNADRIAQRFLYRVLSSEDGQRAIRAKISGSAQPGLKSDFIRNFPVPLPESIAEQSRIAAVLDSVDETIAKTEAVIAKLRQVRAGLLHDLLTRGLDQQGQLRDAIAHPEQFHDTPLGRIPREWAIRTCQSLCREIVVGIVVKPAQYYVDDGIPALRSANIREHGIVMDDLVFISPESNAVLSKSVLRGGDIVTVRTGYPGTTVVVPPDLDGANCVDLVISRPGPDIVPEFLALWVNSPFGKSQVLRVQGGLAQQHFNVGEMKSLLVVGPDTDEQAAIVRRVAEVDALLMGELRFGYKLGHLKSGLMADLLTGRVRVPESLFATEGVP